MPIRSNILCQRRGRLSSIPVTRLTSSSERPWCPSMRSSAPIFSSGSKRSRKGTQLRRVLFRCRPAQRAVRGVFVAPRDLGDLLAFFSLRFRHLARSLTTTRVPSSVSDAEESTSSGRYERGSFLVLYRNQHSLAEAARQ